MSICKISLLYFRYEFVGQTQITISEEGEMKYLWSIPDEERFAVKEGDLTGLW